MDERRKAELFALASPEARAGYEKLDRAGLLTDEMVEALGSLSKGLAALTPDPPGEAPPQDRTMEGLARSVADRHGMSVEEARAELDLY